MTEEYFFRVLAVVIISVVIFGIRWIWIGTNYVNKEYIKPVQKLHKDNRERYRKYLRGCDKKGKRPLTYNQWKFAYADKKGK